MNQPWLTVLRTLGFTITASIMTLPVVAALAENSTAAAGGYFFGTALGSINFALLAISLARAVKHGEAGAKIMVTAHYFLRYMLNFTALWFALKSSKLDFTAVVAGFLLIKAVILLDNIKKSRQGV